MRLVFAQALATLGAALFAAPLSASPAPPPAPAVDAAKLELSNQIAEALWPNGTYQRMMKQMMGGDGAMLDAMFDIRPIDLVGEEAAKKATKDGKLPPEAKQTMREAIRAKDPHFEERMRITMNVMSEEMGKVFAPLEPKLRSGLARAYARRFSAEQLKDIAGFLATPSGRSFATESMLLFTDKELMREMMSGMPEMMKQMPSMMERVGKATSHLPPPPKQEEKEKDADETDSVS